MQIGRFRYPQQELTGTQITICLEAYILWLFGKVMFTDNHVDTISAGFITIVQEISVAQNQDGIVSRSFGSAVLVATYRAVCSVCTKNKESSSILGCPLFLHLWSWERLPIGRPDVGAMRPWDSRIDAYHDDLPTVGSVWTRRQVNFALFMLFKLALPNTN